MASRMSLHISGLNLVAGHQEASSSEACSQATRGSPLWSPLQTAATGHSGPPGVTGRNLHGRVPGRIRACPPSLGRTFCEPLRCGDPLPLPPRVLLLLDGPNTGELSSMEPCSPFCGREQCGQGASLLKNKTTLNERGRSNKYNFFFKKKPLNLK